jgi:hypothetical protein
VVPLGATTPSPFHPESAGRPTADDGEGGAAVAEWRDGDAPPQPVLVDPEAIDQRVVRCRSRPRGPAPARGPRRAVWLETPQAGLLGEDKATQDGERTRPKLQRWDFAKRRVATVVGELDGFDVTGDGRRLLVRDGDAVRIVPSDRRVEPDSEGDRDAVIEVDLRRLRGQVDPAAMWRQMYDEAGRLMRDHYWTPDMADVDWPAVLAKYRPLVDRIATRDDLSEVFWEVIGELGSSHAYEMAAVAAGRARAGRSATSARTWSGSATAGGWPRCCRRVVGPRRPGPAVRARRRGPGGDEILAWTAGRSTRGSGPAPLLAGRRQRAGRADRAAGRRRGRAPGRGAAARRREGAALPGLGGRRRAADARAVRRPGGLPAHPGHGGQRLGASCTATSSSRSPGRAWSSTCGTTTAATPRAGAGEARPYGQGLGQPARQPGGDLSGERAARPDRRGDQPARRAPTATSSPPASRSTASARSSAPAPGVA